MDDRPPGIRRVCVAAGWEAPGGAGPGGASGRDDAAGERRIVREALISACAAAGLQRGLPNQQRHGSAEVLLLPAGIDEPRVLAALTRAIAAELRRINAAGGRRRLRLVLVFHEGVVVLEPAGFRGAAIGRACRLAGAPQARSALASHPVSDLVVLLTDRIFDDLTGHHPDPALGAGQFERVELNDQAACCQAAWICVPALPRPA